MIRLFLIKKLITPGYSNLFSKTVDLVPSTRFNTLLQENLTNMKSAAKLLASTAILLCISSFSSAQILKNIGNRAKQKAEQRANQKIDNAIDKGLDKAENPGQKKDDTNNQNNGASDNRNNNSSNNGNNSGNKSENNQSANNVVANAGFQTYSKFDFVPGDKIIIYDDFMQDAIGDFPGKWNTNSSGEIVTVNGQAGRWLMVNKKGRFIPEYISELPENFTLQFNLMSNEKFDYYSSGLELFFMTGSNDAKVFDDYFVTSQKRSGLKFNFHPVNPGNHASEVTVALYDNGQKVMDNNIITQQFNSHTGNNKVAVSVWRQKQRIRVYVNEEKVFDLPRVFALDKKYTATLFQIQDKMVKTDDRFLINNIKFAIGSPDTRNKLITEGKFVTRGILFDVSSDKIKPESYGVLKDIAGILTENAGVKVKIIGHTDTDGNDADNLSLSKRRAESVKASLASDFAIDVGRMQTDGMGESQPVDKNTTNEAKANNRRVEFIKL